MKSLALPTLVLFAGLAGMASAQRTQNAYLGVSVGTYLPTNGQVRDLFGTSPVSYGVTLVQPYRTARKGLRFDIDSLSLNGNGNRFFTIGGTIGYEIQALRQGDRPTAFARIGVGPAYYDYNVNGSGFNQSGRKLGLLGAAEVGLTINKNFVVSARYLQTSRLDGLDFSGIELKLTVAAFKL